MRAGSHLPDDSVDPAGTEHPPANLAELAPLVDVERCPAAGRLHAHLEARR